MPESLFLSLVLTLSVPLIKDINSPHKLASQGEEKYPLLQIKYQLCLMIKANQCKRTHKTTTIAFWGAASTKSYGFLAILKVFFVFHDGIEFQGKVVSDKCVKY